MRTLALFFLLMVSLSLANGWDRRFWKMSREGLGNLKRAVLRELDDLLARFLVYAKEKYDLTPSQAKVLRYKNRDYVMGNCVYLTLYSRIIMRRQKYHINDRNLKKIAPSIGRLLRYKVVGKYVPMTAKNQIPKLTEYMEEILAKQPEDVPCR
nr:sp18 [Haliotis tuberculata]